MPNFRNAGIRHLDANFRGANIRIERGSISRDPPCQELVGIAIDLIGAICPIESLGRSFSYTSHKTHTVLRSATVKAVDEPEYVTPTAAEFVTFCEMITPEMGA
jgi:hypothetical protein